MKLDNQEIFNEFWKETKDKYPHISYERMKEAVTYPFVHFKNIMKSGTLTTMRFKHLGIFTVYKGKVEAETKKILKLFKEQRMLDKDYFRIKKVLDTYLLNHKEDEKVD